MTWRVVGQGQRWREGRGRRGASCALHRPALAPLPVRYQDTGMLSALPDGTFSQGAGDDTGVVETLIQRCFYGLAHGSIVAPSQAVPKLDTAYDMRIRYTVCNYQG